LWLDFAVFSIALTGKIEAMGMTKQSEPKAWATAGETS
jgi:hypothetical protein